MQGFRAKFWKLEYTICDWYYTIKSKFQPKPTYDEAKYQEALDQLQALLNAYGTMTPIWDKTREIIDRERPLIAESHNPVDKPKMVCSYPSCNCPFDAPADPNWCARGYKKK